MPKTSKIKTSKKSAVKKPALQTFWAMGMIYVPFVMGGDVWQPRKFKIDGEAVNILGFKCFYCFNTVEKRWQIHHVESGGLLGHGDEKADALSLAKENIKTTPDLKEQMKQVGAVENHPEIEAEKFWNMAKDSK